jgi:hypothetical protein
MIFNALTAAAMLLGGICTPNFELRTNVEPASIVASLSLEKMSSATRRILIEQHAAPHWDLSKTQAWALYESGLLTITEVVPELIYLVEYDGILTVVLSDEN